MTWISYSDVRAVEIMSISTMEWIIIGLFTTIGLIIFLLYLAYLLWEHYIEGVAWKCLFFDHVPIDKNGTKVPEPKGLFVSISAFGHNFRCERCNLKVWWNHGYKIWSHQFAN